MVENVEEVYDKESMIQEIVEIPDLILCQENESEGYSKKLKVIQEQLKKIEDDVYKEVYYLKDEKGKNIYGNEVMSGTWLGCQ
jgi:hypothetical protein